MFTNYKRILTQATRLAKLTKQPNVQMMQPIRFQMTPLRQFSFKQEQDKKSKEEND
jgi:hypothetical protein